MEIIDFRINKIARFARTVYILSTYIQKLIENFRDQAQREDGITFS